MSLNAKKVASMSAILCLAPLTGQLYGHSLFQSPESRTSSQNSSSAQKAEPAAPSRLTIKVTAGEKNEPVESASVYVKYIQEHRLRKDKRFEMNVKTNRDGVAHVPDPPKGKILIQIVAPGWKAFGKWFEIEDLSRPIEIHLEKPPRWY
jgi:hypothetical protein